MQEPGAVAAAEAGVDVSGLPPRARRAPCPPSGEGVFVDDVERGLVDEADVDAFLARALHGVERAVQDLAVADHIARGALADDFVLARREGVALAEELAAVFLEMKGTLLRVVNT
jgi:hypothetical protein